MAEATGSSRSGLAQSAEMVVTIALLSVCAAAGIAAWFLSDDGGAVAAATPAAQPSVLESNEAEEVRVLSEWQSRIESDFSQRQQNLLQEEQSVRMKAQAEALAIAQAAADAAEKAVAEAEARAKRAEQERRAALELAERQAKAAPVASSSTKGASGAAALASTANDGPASIDWSTCKTPEYPRISVRRKEEGTVLLGFTVDSEGRSSSGKVIESSGWQRLDEAALEALSKCGFQPAIVGGQPAAQEAQVRFAWALQ